MLITVEQALKELTIHFKNYQNSVTETSESNWSRIKIKALLSELGKTLKGSNIVYERRYVNTERLQENGPSQEDQSTESTP